MSIMQPNVESMEKNTKQLWKMINGIIGKRKHSGSIISYITINGVKTYDTKKIANDFGRYYATMGADLAIKNTGEQKESAGIC